MYRVNYYSLVQVTRIWGCSREEAERRFESLGIKPVNVANYNCYKTKALEFWERVQKGERFRLMTDLISETGKSRAMVYAIKKRENIQTIKPNEAAYITEKDFERLKEILNSIQVKKRARRNYLYKVDVKFNGYWIVKHCGQTKERAERFAEDFRNQGYITKVVKQCAL